MAARRVDITSSLVSKLIGAQFPQWADLPLRPVEYNGWDNRTFRLGEDLAVRLPSSVAYAPQVEKEHRWLPKIAALLPLPIPLPIAMGVPDESYPWHWSVYQWLDGENASIKTIRDLPQFASTLAEFLVALRRIDPTGGPEPGVDNFFRGGPLAIYDAEARHAIVALGGKIDTAAVTSVWEAALKTVWRSPGVWIHGDVAATNLLVRTGRLCAVIDFGCLAVGDPACDLTIAWTLFSNESREAFRVALPFDKGTWARARGWALWKALITLEEHINRISSTAGEAQRVIEEVLADHGRTT